MNRFQSMAAGHVEKSNVIDDEDDDVPTLSADTFSVLQQFYTEQDARDQERREIQVINVPIIQEFFFKSPSLS